MWKNKAHFQCPFLIRYFILNSKPVPNNIKWGGENNRKCQGECETNSVYGLDFLSARFCIVLAWFCIWFEVPGALQRFLSFLVLSEVYEHAFSSIWFLSLWFTFMSIAARGILVCVVLWLCWLKNIYAIWLQSRARGRRDLWFSKGGLEISQFFEHRLILCVGTLGFDRGNWFIKEWAS